MTTIAANATYGPYGPFGRSAATPARDAREWRDYLTGGGRMPFTQNNLRFTLLLGSCCFIALITTVASVWLIVAGYGAAGAAAATSGAGIMGIQLLAMVRAEAERKERPTEQAQVAAHVAAVTVAHTAAEIRAAKDEPPPGMEAMPRNPGELKAFLREFAETNCGEVAKQAAREAASEVAAEAARIAAREAAEMVRRVLEDHGKSGKAV